MKRNRSDDKRKDVLVRTYKKKPGKLTSKSLQSDAKTKTRASKEPSRQKEPVKKAHSVCILSADMTERANQS